MANKKSAAGLGMVAYSWEHSWHPGGRELRQKVSKPTKIAPCYTSHTLERSPKFTRILHTGTIPVGCEVHPA
eukprot:g44798.t1